MIPEQPDTVPLIRRTRETRIPTWVVHGGKGSRCGDAMAAELFEAIEKHDLRRVISLLCSGADVNEGHAANPKWTPLMSAIEELSESGPIEAVILLLRYGAAVNVHDQVPETTPLLFAVLNNQLEAARMLLSAGADPNVRTDEGDSPLRVSVEQDNRAMATLLLLCGATKTIHESGGPSGMSALGRAVWMLNVPMVDVLLKAGADPDRLDGDNESASDRLPPRDSADPAVWDSVMAMLRQRG